ncbi:MAG TPA: tagaturonate epimerase family protein [Bryobacteraceae bacterium]|nr:tagaturonate epimerase family protein [Bryobacteraceae bacterium]
MNSTKTDAAPLPAVLTGIAEHSPNATWFPDSLTRHADALFIALEENGAPLLLQLGGAAGAFGLQGATTRTAHEVTVYLYPFGSKDRANIGAFANKIDTSFLPRPQRAQPGIACGNRHPEVSLPAVFDAFREILHDSSLNLASTVQLSATREMTTDAEIAARDGSNPAAPGHTRVSILDLYHAGLWAAIRAGYRSGYTAEADHFIVSGADDAAIAKSVEWVKEAIRQAADYTKFTTDTSKVFDLRADTRHPSPLSELEIEELYAKRLTREEQAWVQDAFSKPFDCDAATYQFEPTEIKRLAVKFAPSLKLNEDLFDAILKVRNGAAFDFEPSLDEADTLTSAKELIFYMHWLKQRGRPAQLVPPNLGFKKRQAYPESRGALEKYTHHKMWPEVMPRVDADFAGNPIAELQDRVRELADVAAYFDGTLSIHSGSGKQPEVLRSIGAATDGRLNYKISGELQLQLFDVLSECREGSPERALYERMVAACERFAAQNAFGEESALAAQYRASGHGSYLGNASAGRVDGNLFLVFWLGNMVGCKDEDGKFFKDHLDALPASIISETQRRNREYVKWLASHLFELG